MFDKIQTMMIMNSVRLKLPHIEGIMEIFD